MLSHGAKLPGRCFVHPTLQGDGGEEGRSAADISGSSAKGLKGEDDNRRGAGPAARQHCGAAGSLCPRQRLPIHAPILVQFLINSTAEIPFASLLFDPLVGFMLQARTS